MYGNPLPFRVLHISEFLAEAVREGKLPLKPMQDSVTFHDPCQVSRRGGATSAPREVLASLKADLKDMPPAGDANWCCGGGGGVVTLHRADEHRYRVFEIKMKQVEATGGEPARAGRRAPQGLTPIRAAYRRISKRLFPAAAGNAKYVPCSYVHMERDRSSR